MKCFPRDPTLRMIWKQRVGRADWEPSNNSFLCHMHFEPNQWIVSTSGRIKLKKGALPSIFTVTSTRKSAKKRQKLGEKGMVDEDNYEYEVEYLDSEETMFLDMTNDKSEPGIVNLHQVAPGCNESMMQNIKFISNDALKNLQNENVIIVADEHNREIGKLVNDNRFVLMKKECGKENVKVSSNVEKLISPSDMKVEVKEEVEEFHVEADYDEIERKLHEICHSENDTSDNHLNENSMSQSNNCDNSLGETGESQMEMHAREVVEEIEEKGEEEEGEKREEEEEEDTEEDTEERNNKGNFNHETGNELPPMRAAMKRKRKTRNEMLKSIEKSVVENRNSPNSETVATNNRLQKDNGDPTKAGSQAKETMFTIKVSGIPEDVSDIIRDLDTETSMECDVENVKMKNDYKLDGNAFITSVITVKENSPTCSEDIFESDKLFEWNKSINGDRNKAEVLQSHLPKLKFKTECNSQGSSTGKTEARESSRALTDKVNMQCEVIEKLTNQLIMYKDLDTKMNIMSRELQNKKKEIEFLHRKLNSKKTLINKKVWLKGNEFFERSRSHQEALFEDLKSTAENLDDTNKKLMKTITIETQNRRKLECQVRNRDNQIKELHWKLDKASKYLERAEKNANTYRKKMLTMQALIRRKKLLEGKNSQFDEIFLGHCNKEFSESALQTSLEIEKACSINGYRKLLSFNFPLPTVQILCKRFPLEFVMEDDGSCEAVDNMDSTRFYAEEYLDFSDTVTGTVQDIFDESSDSDDMCRTALQRHLNIDPNRTV